MLFRGALATLALAVLILSFLAWQAALNAEDAARAAVVARERAECITSYTGPFFADVSVALVELNDDGTLSPATADALRADAANLSSLNEACPS